MCVVMGEYNYVSVVCVCVVMGEYNYVSVMCVYVCSNG